MLSFSVFLFAFFFFCFPNSRILFFIMFSLFCISVFQTLFLLISYSLAMSLYFHSPVRPRAAPLTTSCVSATKPWISPLLSPHSFLQQGFSSPRGGLARGPQANEESISGRKKSHAVGSKFSYPVCSQINSSLKGCFLSTFSVNETSADQDAFW